MSATVGNPDEAGRFLVGSERKFRLIHDTSLRNYDVDVVFVDGIMDDVAVEIIQYVKKQQITSPVLLFTNSRGESERLSSILKQKTSLNVELHHGSLSRQVREETEDLLKEGKSGIVVCTSSLELGLDIGSVELVIHYGSPRQVSKFMQRIGRSKHNRGSSARGLIITESADDEFEIKAIIERIKEGSIEEQKIHYGSLDVLAHHLVGLSMQVGNVPIESALKLTKLAYPFQDISLKEFFDVLDVLALRQIIIFNEDKTEYKLKAKVVVLAASACSSARILLNSKSKQHPNGLGNSSGVVGKYLHDSTGGGRMAFLPELVDRKIYNEDGVGGMHVYSPWWLDNKKLDFPRGYHIEVWGGMGMPSYGTGFNPNDLNKYLGLKVGGYGNQLKKDVKKFYGSVMGMSGRGESIARKDNYCEIDPTRVDEFGIPILRFSYQWSDYEKKQAKHMHNTFEEICRKCDGRTEPRCLKINGNQNTKPCKVYVQLYQHRNKNRNDNKNNRNPFQRPAEQEYQCHDNQQYIGCRNIPPQQELS